MNYSNFTDEQLVNTVVDGHIDVFGILYDRYSQKVYSKCLTFAESPGSAKDLTCDIFLKAFSNLKRFKDGAKFSNWLYAITYTQCIDDAQRQYLHKKNNYLELDEIERLRVKVVHCDTEQRLLDIKAEKLEKILEKLPPVDRMILLMKYQDNMSTKEIQEQLQISESAVKISLHRACERAMTIHDKILKSYEEKTVKSISRAY